MKERLAARARRNRQWCGVSGAGVRRGRRRPRCPNEGDPASRGVRVRRTGGWVAEDHERGREERLALEDFTAYADVCFREFGDRVKYWITVIEPSIEPILGHDLGIFPPNHYSSSLASSLGLNCSKGNSSVEPYVAGHNLLLSHASAVSLYRKKYQSVVLVQKPYQGGYIGITLLGIWFEPATRLPDDIAAVNRALDFLIGCLR
ncbi:hypothetical protein ZIOFF_021916 [Zingiber officinale]|uniref:Uncharacterized protein n=1 Tax=Zingiber officinale TaxID=94328 RepID=A0A8J5H0U2_ZINOF|nr:hypothetical protein ZIOFF_021916 [Zingiber officinale]